MIAAQQRVSSKTIDGAIGGAVSDLRAERGMSARELAERSRVSPAMISRIESGQVSPSISTLQALSDALGVPLVALFRNTVPAHADWTHVKGGDGLRSARVHGEHNHEFTQLSFHRRADLQFEAHRITLTRQGARPPTYVAFGVVFLYAVQGRAIYQYGGQELTLDAGDSLSVDGEMNHGFKEVLTPKFTFLSVQAGRG